MKKTFLLGSIVLTAGLGLAAASGPVLPEPGESAMVAADRTARGHGTISFGDDGAGVAMFEFNVSATGKAQGSLLFAAEEPHAYPSVIIRVNEIVSVRFRGRTAMISARGHLHDDPVTVLVTVFDGNGTSRPDRFTIKTVGADGDGHFQAAGEVVSGNIRVGAAE